MYLQHIIVRGDIMCCKIADLKNKQVVCVSDGGVLGFVSDVEFDIETGNLTAIIIYGKPKLFGVFGREDDLRILWKDISVIGNETVLVNCAEIFKEKNGGIFKFNQ